MTGEPFLDGRVTLFAGDCRDTIRALADCSVDSVVTDPPYALDFMGKKWDTGETAFDPEFWADVRRVLKPGGYVAAFSGTRTYHRLATAIEDAGFEIRDQLAWVYGTGFPKSLDVSKAIDKHYGATREKVRVERVRNPKATRSGRDGMDGGARPFIVAAIERGFHEVDGNIPATPEAAAWSGWGTALKPAWEPIVLARKPLIGTVAETVLAHGTGGLNIDACRVGDGADKGAWPITQRRHDDVTWTIRPVETDNTTGRFPANIIHDGSDEVLAAFPGIDGTTAARFFYSAKADDDDRLGADHPTVKPVDLMQWLARLITPPGGTILEPFAGTGTTGAAAFREGFRAILCEREDKYCDDIRRRMALELAGPATRRTERAKAKAKRKGTADHGLLFGERDMIGPIPERDRGIMAQPGRFGFRRKP